MKKLLLILILALTNIACEDKTSDTHLIEGNKLFAQQQYNEAIEEYKEAIDANPKNIKAFNNWGNILIVTGEYGEAIEKFQKAAKINPENADTFYNWGVALNKIAKLKNKDANEKFKEYNRLIKIK